MFDLTRETIATSYEALKSAVTAAFEAGEAAIEAKARLEEWRAVLLLEGRIDGKNEAQREAQARQLLPEKFEGVEAYEADARRTRHTLEIARLDVESLRAQLRLMELVEVPAA